MLLIVVVFLSVYLEEYTEYFFVNIKDCILGIISHHPLIFITILPAFLCTVIFSIVVMGVSYVFFVVI